MNARRIVSWLPIAGMLAAVAGALGWLLLIFAGNRGGVEPWAHATSSGLAGEGRAGSTLEYFVEKQGSTTTRAQVEQLPAEAWRRWTGAGHYTGGFGTVLWARVTLRNAEAQARAGVLADVDFFADRVEAWVVAKANANAEAYVEKRVGDNALHLVSGEGVAAAEKAVPGRAIAFPVSVPARGEQVAYLRAEDFYRPVFQLEWWPDATAYHAAKTRGLVAEAVYFGGLLALLGYNVLLWVRLRLADIGYYAAYLGTGGMFLVLARAWGLELGATLGSPGLETALTVALALGAFFLACFARAFLELKERCRWGDRVAGWLAMMMAGLALGALSTPWIEIKGAIWLPATVAGIGVTHVGLLVLAVVAWRAGARQARFFVLSFGCLVAGSLPLVAVRLWMLGPKNAAMMGLMIGSALEMLLLALAVADRFATAQREKAAAQARLIEEAEQRRVIEAAYADELEIEVAERTRDLEAANTDKDRMLIALGHDLRSPLAALTQRAEQLRGGSRVPMAEAATTVLGEFSGDVAGAGRQMLLLIEDIVLWARLRTGAQPAASAHAVVALVTPVVRLHRPLAERRGVALTVGVPESLVAWTDLVLAQTMVRNLVGNAVKFARSRVEVSARAEPEAGAVRITVRDDGPGLPPAVLARLRGEASAAGDNGEGGGMGLRLCLEIGVTLRAKIEAGEPSAMGGGGTELSVILPATDRGAGEAVT